MRFGDVLVCEVDKDGGPESKVMGFWLFRDKKRCTVALLRFDEGSRDAFHSHAFNAWSWLLSGGLYEQLGDYLWDGQFYWPSLKTIYTPRERKHKVHGLRSASWVLTFRGPWVDTWQEYVPETGELKTLTHNRVVVSSEKVKCDS